MVTFDRVICVLYTVFLMLQWLKSVSQIVPFAGQTFYLIHCDNCGAKEGEDGEG